MIKTLLMFKHQAIPAQVNYQEQNPYIELENTPFYISNEKQDWTRENNEYPDVLESVHLALVVPMHM